MKGNRGFIKAIILIVIALVVLGFFGYNLKDIINSPTVKDNLFYVWNAAVLAVNWVWDLLVSVFEKIRAALGR
jgi:hypothetical protein